MSVRCWEEVSTITTVVASAMLHAGVFFAPAPLTADYIDPAETESGIFGGEPYFGDLAEVHTWAREYYRDLWAFAEKLDAHTLAGRVEFPWAGELVKWFGEARPATVQETVIQVSMHTAHHRGQLCTLIRELGGEPPLVDFIGWVWMGKPRAVWQPLTAS